MAANRISLGQIFVALAVFGVFLAVAKAFNVVTALPLLSMVLGGFFAISTSFNRGVCLGACLCGGLALLPPLGCAGDWFAWPDASESLVSVQLSGEWLTMGHKLYELACIPLEMIAACSRTTRDLIFFQEEGPVTTRPIAYYFFWMGVAVLFWVLAIRQHIWRAACPRSAP